MNLAPPRSGTATWLRAQLLLIFLFPAPALAEFDLYDDDSIPFPANCGRVRSSAPLTGNLSELVLDDGAGNARTLYYYHHPREKQCGDMAGKICFTIAGEIAVTAAMATRGVRGGKVTIIRDCMEVD